MIHMLMVNADIADIHTRRYLKDRDYKDFVDLFTLLGLHEFIRYETFSSLSSKIMVDDNGHLPEVRGTFERCVGLFANEKPV